MTEDENGQPEIPVTLTRAAVDLGLSRPTLKKIIADNRERLTIRQVGSQERYYLSEIEDIMTVNEPSDEPLDEDLSPDMLSMGTGSGKDIYFIIRRGNKTLSQWAVQPTDEDLVNGYGPGEYIVQTHDARKNHKLIAVKKHTVGDGYYGSTFGAAPVTPIQDAASAVGQLMRLKNELGGDGNGKPDGMSQMLLQVMLQMLQSQTSLTNAVLTAALGQSRGTDSIKDAFDIVERAKRMNDAETGDPLMDTINNIADKFAPIIRDRIGPANNTGQRRAGPVRPGEIFLPPLPDVEPVHKTAAGADNIKTRPESRKASFRPGTD